MPLARLVATAGQVAQGAPYALEKLTPRAESDRALVALVRSSRGQGLSVHLILEAHGDRIEGLIIRPHVDAKVAASWAEVAEMLRAAAPSVNFLAADIDSKKCVPLASIDPQKPLALASAFKLYVLDALAMQIASGQHGWDESIAIEDTLKSLPSGKMRDEPAGKTFTVRQFAEQMISVSDNTANRSLDRLRRPRSRGKRRQVVGPRDTIAARALSVDARDVRPPRLARRTEGVRGGRRAAPAQVPGGLRQATRRR